MPDLEQEMLNNQNQDDELDLLPDNFANLLAGK
jgi:hypothetical protein